MQKRPEIILPPDTVFILTRDIPALIANALHPVSESQPEKITALHKISKAVASDETSEQSELPIDEDDWKILEGIWSNLPKLVLPITVDAWEPYADAFKEKAAHLDWGLHLEETSNSQRLRILRGAAKRDHRIRLKTAIESGEIQQLRPVTNLPTTKFYENGKVPVKALTQYVEQLFIDVRFAVLVDNTLTQVKQIPSNKKAGGNKKIWDDAKSKALWEESIMPGVTQQSLAEKHGVSRQRIAKLIKTVKEKNKSVKSPWGDLRVGPRTIKGKNT